MSHT
ncbi:hypothetical protein D047_5086A, partial [Vibrio parahaemolyticus VPTS-2010_2]